MVGMVAGGGRWGGHQLPFSNVPNEVDTGQCLGPHEAPLSPLTPGFGPNRPQFNSEPWALTCREAPGDTFHALSC